MKASIKIVMVGGGSVNWSPTLINDLVLTSGLQNAQFTILDVNEEAGNKMVQFGRMLVKSRDLACDFYYTGSRKEAFTNADYVIITISTGDLDAMEYDLKIPEDYRIYQTVGDTVGPGGWARGLRNIPVLAEMARDIEKYSPKAIVLNYTNPMAVLTNVFYKVGRLKTVGLCHGLFEVYDVLMKIFKLESEEEIKVRFGGTNHFFWITDLKIQGDDGYELLRHKLNGGPFAELVTDVYMDGAGFHSDKWVCSELYEYFGFLPYVADRHICEFLPWYLTQDTVKIEKYKLERTFIKQRREWKQKGRERLEALIAGHVKVSDKRSRETAANIIGAFATNREFIDVVNLPNEGQIPNLPKGSVVETLGVINSVGFTPLTSGVLPEQILNLQLPHVSNQDLIVEAGLEGDMEKAFYALYNDPLCSHLTIPEIKEMGMRLLKTHERFLPQFFDR